MIIKNDVAIRSISWLSGSYIRSGLVKNYYEPESVDELIELCRKFYISSLEFDLVGHTSNILYTLDYCCENMVSTRKCKKFEINEKDIVCECGVPVRQLSIAAVEIGVKGFEGLIDLPGTVASALYGHATCYNCDISDKLIESKVLIPNGDIITVKPDWFEFGHRSSALKRGEKKGIILTATFRRENGNSEVLKSMAEQNHSKRRQIQPEAKNSLGSIFRNHGEPTFLYRVISILLNPYCGVLSLMGKEKDEILKRKKHLVLKLLGASDIEQYVRTWNWYQWKDEQAHVLFGKYVRIHKLLFAKSDFEIEIKKNT